MTIKIAAIVAMADNNVIGKDNVMPWHISADLKRVKALTMGKPCVMGRKTFESILSYLGKPLPGRTNIIVSRSGFEAQGALSFTDVHDALDAAKEIAARDNQDEVIIFGGAQIYMETLALLDRMHLTLVHRDYEGDTYFPAFDKENWQETMREDFAATEDQPAYSFITLDRR